ncbi:MAG: hypothetical protein R3181_14205 [Rubricoccaceae bacterium]|nr:hypothetical protein [Rubricoccaceae bacterium]
MEHGDLAAPHVVDGDADGLRRRQREGEAGRIPEGVRRRADERGPRREVVLDRERGLDPDHGLHLHGVDVAEVVVVAGRGEGELVRPGRPGRGIPKALGVVGEGSGRAVDVVEPLLVLPDHGVARLDGEVGGVELEVTDDDGVGGLGGEGRGDESREEEEVPDGRHGRGGW